jgi:methylmalonyl-CoA/ethylmalonyl-CoA epimerase
MRIEGLIKIGVATNDLDKTTSVLADALGLVPGEAVAYQPFGMRYRILMLGDFFIEVIEPTGSDGPIAAFIEQHGEGLQHITLKVSDIEQVMADMKSKGARFTASAPVKLNTAIGPVKFAFMNPRGSNGVLVQLMEILE